MMKITILLIIKKIINMYLILVSDYAKVEKSIKNNKRSVILVLNLNTQFYPRKGLWKIRFAIIVLLIQIISQLHFVLEKIFYLCNQIIGERKNSLIKLLNAKKICSLVKEMLKILHFLEINFALKDMWEQGVKSVIF